jgi:hypothetical protein
MEILMKTEKMKLEDAKHFALSYSKKNNVEMFIAKTVDELYVIQQLMPYVGEWYHVYPDGEIVRRG